MTEFEVLACLGGKNGDAFSLQTRPEPKPRADEVELAVTASSVNPIDVARASGYGRRLLSLMGAGTFPMVLGNDVAGTVLRTGAKVTGLQLGQKVYGLKPASRSGPHAARVVVKAAHVRAVPETADPAELAALPYCFATMYLAVRGAGLTRENANGRKVLVHGAAGGLGILALQMLADWGAETTAIAWPDSFEACRAAGAAEVVDTTTDPFAKLSGRFDATLNFATWDHDVALIGCLHEGALGHATTVHPMLRNFDELGFLRGALQTMRGKKRMRSALPKGVQNYAWVIFKPDAEALAELDRLVAAQIVGLPIALRVPLARGAEAFAYMRGHPKGRALILP